MEHWLLLTATGNVWEAWQECTTMRLFFKFYMLYLQCMERYIPKTHFTLWSMFIQAFCIIT